MVGSVRNRPPLQEARVDPGGRVLLVVLGVRADRRLLLALRVLRRSFRQLQPLRGDQEDLLVHVVRQLLVGRSPKHRSVTSRKCN